MNCGDLKTLLVGRAERRLTAVAICLIALLIGACGGGKKASELGTTSSPPSVQQGTSTLSLQTATAVFQSVATALARLHEVPVISQNTAPGWQEEGEAGAKLTQVCPSAVQRQPFAEDASRLLRRTSGEQARSAAVIYLDLIEGRAYAQQVFGDAAICAQALVRAWFGQTTQFSAGTSQAGLGDEAVLVQSAAGATPAAALFFRRQEAVAAVAVLGPDSAQLISQLATVQEGAIKQKLQSLIQTPGAQ